MPSTVIRHFTYDEYRQELDVTFRSGRRYHYFNVPERIAKGMRDAPSKGEYFNAFVRDHFRYQLDGESLG